MIDSLCEPPVLLPREHSGSIDFSRAGAPDWALGAARGLNRFLCRSYHNLRVLRPCPIPAQGPAILICNHISALDPCLLQSTCRRVIVWMVAAEFYELPGLNWFFRRIQAI